MTLLAISDLSKSYNGVPALAGVRLDLASGDVHALMGENGAGKSTLIKILAGAVRRDSGTIRIDGQPVEIETPTEAHALGLRFIHQELSIVGALSVAENIALGKPYPRRFGGLIDWRALNEAATRALAALGIDHIDPAIRMARLSTGNQMLVKIAAAFLDDGGRRGRVYVMDEPTAALTDAESERLFSVIDRLTAEGCGILYVSHRMDEVMRLATRVTVMRDGQTVSCRPITDTGKARIIEEMTGRTLAETFPPRRKDPDEAIVLRYEEEPSAQSGADGRGLAFTLRRGEILGIAGLAGSGRSELLGRLMGALPGGHSTLSLSGRPIRNDVPAAAWANGFAYVPRERRAEGLMLSKPITDNIVLPHLAAISRARVFAAPARESRLAGGLAAKVRLKSTGLGQRVIELSGGNQQKVVFARAVGGGPSVLLLDEPTRGVDVGARFDICQLLRDLTADGLSVIMTSSDLPELVAMCDRIAVMADGEIRTIVSAEGLTAQTLLSLCYEQADRPARNTSS